MKNLKRIVAVLLCLCLVAGLSVMTVSAADTGSITIENPSHSDSTVAGKTFKLYKIFNATSDGSNIAYSWTDGQKFYNFFFGPDGKVTPNKADGTAQQAVEWISAHVKSNIEISQFAEELHAYIGNNSIGADADVTGADGVTSVQFTSLDYGYYLVDDATSLTGAAVRSAIMLSNVNKDVVISLKANRPKMNKFVKENDGSTWGETTSVTVGDTVKFRIELVVPSHIMYEKYTYYVTDKMCDALDYKNNLKVYYDGAEIAAAGHYTVGGNDTNEIFKIDFTDFMTSTTTFTTPYEAGKVIAIEYEAKVNGKIEPHNLNRNTAILTYSNDPANCNLATATYGTTEDTANVVSYLMVISKFSTDSVGGIDFTKRLSGAKFTITHDSTLLKFRQIPLTHGSETISAYIVDPDGTITDLEVLGGSAPSGSVDNATYHGGHLGDLTIFGLSEGVYKIAETVAPAGYQVATSTFDITITDATNDAGEVYQLNASGSFTGDGAVLGNVGGNNTNLLTYVDIGDKPGQALPETGGMGTTLFTVVGIVLMAGAAAFFTSRKRNSAA
ncbi:MAG: isopeptide-forming domain-containing fimbrial protein [Clostridia bacterium]|nr:isopeptide-forming domain-containing fimbrial protein [Clostridia bacterium]